MSRIRMIDRLMLPDYGNTKQVNWASIKIDEEKCTGCSLCVRACPADSIYLYHKKARMKPATGKLAGDPGRSQCMGCGDCTAICPAGAITIETTYRWTKCFRTIDRGDSMPPRL